MITEDTLFRIYERVLEAAGIPFDKKCWIRSGITSLELRNGANRLMGPPFDLDLRDALQAILLDHYLIELVVDNIISDLDRKKYLKEWANS